MGTQDSQTTLIRVMMEALKTIYANSEGPVQVIAAVTLNTATNILSSQAPQAVTPHARIGFAVKG